MVAQAHKKNGKKNWCGHFLFNFICVEMTFSTNSTAACALPQLYVHVATSRATRSDSREIECPVFSQISRDRKVLRSIAILKLDIKQH